MATSTINEVKAWLEKALTSENLKNISVEIEGNSEKGDGFIGDIVFVKATGSDSNNTQKVLNLVLKCSKKSEKVRETMPVENVFHNEINLYSHVIPDFQNFQKSKSVENIFDNVPKYYGHFTNKTTEIIVLENLKKVGYNLWDRCTPLTKEHILMVMEKYGQFHSISVAIRDQDPERFQNLGYNKVDALEEILKTIDFPNLGTIALNEVYNLLKDSCDGKILEKFVQFKDQLEYVFLRMKNEGDLKIVSHGDCWNNNFMWQHHEQNPKSPKKVVIIDWQVSSIISPIFDLSYFMFSCIANEDLPNVNLFLDTYYNSFSKSLQQLGSDSSKLYPKEQFLTDWKKFARYGFAMCLILIKAAFCKKENLPDMTKSAEDGQDITETFVMRIDDEEGFRKRIKPVVEYVVQNHLID